MTKTDLTVGIVMGSISDWPTMKHSKEMLDRFGVPSDPAIVSAHRTPERLREYAKTAVDRGLCAIIAGAGGAAHLPGMLASWTTLPVFGVPVESRVLRGVDSLLSIVQMPGGVPVGTLAIGEAGARNAALLVTRMLSVHDPELRRALEDYRDDLAAKALEHELS